MSATIYYFSGTGNSYRVAKAICDDLENSKLVDIAKEHNQKHEATSNVVGFVFPLYYFGLPVIIEKFLEQLELPENAYVFIIVTRGEPMAGGAKKQLDVAFKAKNMKYQFFRYITMGNNYPFHIFNGSAEKVKLRRNSNADRKVASFLPKIKAQRQSKVFSILDYPPFPSITLRLPTFGYKHFLQIYDKDSFFTVDEARCTKCKKCEHACPTNNIEISSKVEWVNKKCQLCLACYNCCPENAIQYIDPNNRVDTTRKRQFWNFS